MANDTPANRKESKGNKRRPAPAAADDGNAAGAPAPDGFPIVGIGASAGGLAAFEAFISALPPGAESGMAFVLVQHLLPDHKSALVGLVQRDTTMPVREATDGMPVQPNHVYTIPPNHDLTLADGALHLARHDAPQNRPHLTIDRFFSSLAVSLHERAICIVMSGTGSDGTQGLRDVKGEGGLVLAQAPETAEYDGMPRSAIATGMVDWVLPPAQMPARLSAYVNHAFGGSGAQVEPLLRDGLLKKVCLLLRAQTGHDFSQYKESTLVRRLERRMALNQVTRPEDYLRVARDNPAEGEALFRDLLIGVTSFFRDPEAFALLEEKVIAPLVASKPLHEPVRMWVCGCSTGEEAYSIAILLFEHMMAAKRVLKVQIFATDIDPQAIEQARLGLYPASIAGQVGEERLAAFFTLDAQRGSYRIQKQIRDLLVFSEQDVIKDPPFSRLDLITCRNLMIYLNADLQRRLIPLFHYALNPGGALFLGTSETVGESAQLFQTVDRKWKLYVSLADGRPVRRRSVPELAPPVSGRAERPAALAAHQRADEPGNLRQITEKALLAHYSQAGVLINGRGQILHIVGRTGRFLEPAVGDAEMNIVAMARDGLRRAMTVALHRVVAHQQPVAFPGLNIQFHGDRIKANLAVRPVEMRGGTPLYLVILEEAAERQAANAPGVTGGDDGKGGEGGEGDRIGELERDLRAKDEYLQTTLEQMETTNEELKSVNEEMQSTNEELQSTNQELETSKEELQSVNEELSTVNAELQDKVTDLSHANNDMNNLLAGTGVGTVFVDNRLRITRFTPAATQVIHLIDGDVGRPLEHVATNLIGYDHLIDDLRGVLDTLSPKDAEVQTKRGAWFLLRIQPYRTTENRIEGAVLTLVDISARKTAEESLRRSEARLSAFVNQAHAGVSETDFEGRIQFVNDHLCERLGYARDELLHKRLTELTCRSIWLTSRPRRCRHGNADCLT